MGARFLRSYPLEQLELETGQNHRALTFPVYIYNIAPKDNLKMVLRAGWLMRFSSQRDPP